MPLELPEGEGLTGDFCPELFGDCVFGSEIDGWGNKILSERFSENSGDFIEPYIESLIEPCFDPCLYTLSADFFEVLDF